MQEKYLLSLQENKHPRDLIYELSTFYLTASCYNLAMQLSLPLLIPTQGISINKLTNELPDYAPEAIR
ncbi:MAG: hypothetical protein K2Q33_05350, partial [Gammaproteobacteria bacterium]|nr:hypothetical protein [Gammaproteobacteria bacterium]